MKKIAEYGLRALLAIGSAYGLAAIAINRGEHINSMWMVIASVCTYLLAYRFYAAFIAAKVLALDDKRATPSERMRDGHDYEPTNKWILFGRHFAAIAGPGPLVGPTLAAQFGYLPGTCGSWARCWGAACGTSSSSSAPCGAKRQQICYFRIIRKQRFRCNGKQRFRPEGQPD